MLTLLSDQSGSRMMNYQEITGNFNHFHALYGNRLADHLPMAIFALNEMGASAEQVEYFYHRYSKRLTPLTQGQLSIEIDEEFSWGQSYEYYQCFFHIQIQALSKDEFLRKYVNFFAKGLSASAFHALIRLAFAVESQNEDELVNAMALFAIEYQELKPSVGYRSGGLLDSLEEFSYLGESCDFPEGIIVDRMQAIHQRIQDLELSVVPADLNWNTLAEFCAKVYRHHEDFTILHTVTGLHALRLVSPYLEDESQALQEMAYCVLVACWSTGRCFESTFTEPSIEELPSWVEIRNLACQSLNDHVIKLVYTCSHEEEHYADPIYRYLAARTVRLTQ